MSEKETDQIKESAESESSRNAVTGLAAEAASQLGDYVSKKTVISDHQMLSSVINDRSWPLSDKERTAAVDGLGKSLDHMVKGDIPDLIKRMKELGVSTAELEAKEKELSKQVEAAKPLQEAILKGDVKALQKMVSEMKPEELEKMTDLIQKHFDRAGLGIEVDFTEGKLILSGTKADRAIAISKDKLDVIGVNPDGSYDFNRHFRRENPAAELKSLSDRSLSNYLNPPYYKKALIHDNDLIIPSVRELHNSSSSVPKSAIQSIRVK